MIDGLRPYAEMKPSGLPWLGDVPAHWDVRRAKRLLRPTQLPVRPDDEIVTCFRDGQVTLRKNRRASGFMIALLEQGYQHVRVGQLVVHSMDAFAGAIGVSDSDGKCTPEYIVCEPRSEETIPGYYSWVLRQAARTGYILASCPAVRERAPRLRYPDLAELRVPVPPLDEQRLIVRFLDYHGAQTAKLIRAKKKIIALLNEQKQAIIHRAVTRGLDPNVRLKPSGIPWLGDVPEGWEVKRLKTFVQNKIEQRAFRGEGEIYVALEHIESWSGRLLHRDFESQFDSQVKSFAPGDILFGKLRPYLAKVTRLDVGGVCVGELLVLRASEAVIDPAFLECRIRTSDFIELVNSSTFGAKMPRADWDFIGNVRMAVPPSLDEQRAISSFIQGATRELTTAAARVSDEIALIQEFRTRLIADVVTGKLDVRAVAASLPETSEAEPIDDLTEDDDLDEAVDDAENEEVAA